MTTRRSTTFLLTICLALAGLASVVPSASAHTCAAHDGCDASSCPDGEDHDHTDYNADTEDEHCSSSANAPGGDCYYFNTHFPPLVCWVLELEPATQMISNLAARSS